MARLGANPARGSTTDYRPAEVTVVLLTYIPSLEGYFAQRLDILRLVIQALVRHTRVPFDLMVVDNGSCEPVLDYLRDLRRQGVVDYLLSSRRNIGQFNALRMAAAAAPGEIIAYVEDDILLYPGWLEAELAVLKAFPEAGMVSGVPVRDATRLPHQALDTFLSNLPPDVTVHRGRFVPDEWERDWAQSTGRDPEAHLAATRDWQDIVLERDGVRAYAVANHFQFLSPKSLMLQALPATWTAYLMGPMEVYDEAVDRLGRLRLSTTQRYARHLGNVLTPELLAEVRDLGLDAAAPRIVRRTRKHWLLRIPGMGRLLWPLYRFLYRVLHRVE